MSPVLGRLHVVALGLSSPLGLDRRATLLELAAGADVFAQTDLLDARNQAIRACRLDLLPTSASRSERMIGLGCLALDELLAIIQAFELGPLPLVLALPEADGAAIWQPGVIMQALLAHARAAGVTLVPSTKHAALPDAIRRSGAAGVFELLVLADALLDAGHDPLLLGAIDSRCDPTSLLELARAGRLIEGGTEGYLPSEGAGFVLLARDLTKLPTPTRPFTILAATHDVEPRPFSQPEPSAALGLTRALRSLRVGPPAIERVDFALSCQWDATYWARELVQAYLRNAQLFPEPLRVEAISGLLGNPGAAGPLLAFGRAIALVSERAASSQAAARALIFGCAHAGPLGACVIEGSPSSALLELPRPLPTRLDQLAFEADRLRDHLEVIGSLLVERHDDLVGDRYFWPELAALELRLQARVWAALERTRGTAGLLDELLDHEDPELARAASYLRIGYGSPEQASRALERVLALDDDELSIARCSLGHALHGRDAALLMPLLDSSVAPHLRRWSFGLLDALGDRPADRLIALLDEPELDDALRLGALGLLARSGSPLAHLRIDAAWQAEPERPELIELMLTLGRHDVLDHLRLALHHGRPLAAAVYEVWSLAASPRDADSFARLATLDSLEPTHLWALSSFGSTDAVPLLLDALDQPALTGDAAIGLERILGANLIAPLWSPDADAEHPEREGESRLQVIRDPDRWRSSWSELAPRFAKGTRLRLGRSLDAHARVDELAHPSSLLCMRKQALRELAASLGTPLHFGFEWPIAVQQHAIANLRAWLEAR